MNLTYLDQQQYLEEVRDMGSLPDGADAVRAALVRGRQSRERIEAGLMEFRRLGQIEGVGRGLALTSDGRGRIARELPPWPSQRRQVVFMRRAQWISQRQLYLSAGGADRVIGEA